MKDLTHILNWRRINPRITTSGQPTETQLAEIRALGVTHIINLGPHHNKGALNDEAGTVATPTQMPKSMSTASTMRGSVLFYRYARSRPDLPEARAFEITESIWKPSDDWADFINDPSARGVPNRYADEDY